MNEFFDRRLRLAFAAITLASSVTTAAAAAASQVTQQLSREEAIACASLGILHASLTEKGLKISEGIDYEERSKYWLQYAIDARPAEWEEQRMVDEFNSFHDKAVGFFNSTLERYQNNRSDENLKPVLDAVQGLKQNLAQCDTFYPG